MKCKVIDIDEYNTSKICCWCRNGEYKTQQLKWFSPAEQKHVKKFGNLCCSSPDCNLFIDRDINGAANIQFLTELSLSNLARPQVFIRPRTHRSHS